MWGYNTNMGQFGGPMTPRMNMGGGPRGFSPWMQGMPNGFQPPNFANNMGEVFGGMPGGGGPMQFNMGSQPGKMPGNPMPNMPQRPFGFGGGGGNQPRPMEIPPQVAQQLFGYQKPVNDIYQESPSKSTRSKADNGWLNSMMNENPYLRPMRIGNSGMGGMNMGGTGGSGSDDMYQPMILKLPPGMSGDEYDRIIMQRDKAKMLGGMQGGRSMGGFNPRMMGGGMGMGLGMGMTSPQMSTQQAAELYFRNMFGGGMR